MNLALYNTATRRQEPFEPLVPGRVGIYVCGVTVYDLCHIGHARSAIVFDVLVRYLRARGLQVTYVRNFTDIDDKIIRRAIENGKDARALAETFIAAFYEDMGRLGVLQADWEPRATEHIPGMLATIERLVDRGFAYALEGDVYFSVEAFPAYGGLSGRRMEDMKAGQRIAVDVRKRHPMDFALWKAAKPGEPAWDSPWGPGRPGWHIECSVMSHHYLGASFDIHGGGEDLLFPHHENERAQSLAANGGSFAATWVHNGFVTVEGEKMSKSLGNFLTIRDALDIYPPEVLRLFLLSKHYRGPLDFAKEAVLASQAGLVRAYRTLQRLDARLGPNLAPPREGEADANPGEETFLGRFYRAMDDDLNTVEALGAVFEKIREINRHLEMDGASNAPSMEETLQGDRHEVAVAGHILGLFEQEPGAFFTALAEKRPDEKDIAARIAARREARAKKDWAGADALRDELKAMGVILEDTPKGTTWRWDV